MRLLLLLLLLLFLPFDDVFLLVLPFVLFVGFFFFFLSDDRAVFVKLAVFTEDVEEAEEEVVLEGAVFGLPDDELSLFLGHHSSRYFSYFSSHPISIV